jgi:hypothetical protein
MPDVLDIPYPWNTGDNTFSLDPVNGITLTNSNVPGNPLVLQQLNTHSMLQPQMLQRFFADIVKDSQADSKVTNVIQILQQCFPNHLNAIPANIAGYKVLLQMFDNRVFTDNIDNITILKNILKTSTVGSNIKISDALWALYESGFGCSSVCRNPGMQTVKTPPATLDSLLKQAYDYLFNPNVIFDEHLSTRLGIPDGFTWRTRPATAADGHNWEQKSHVNIRFWNPPPGGAAHAVRSGIINNEANNPDARGPFDGINGNGDIMGNKPKNEVINQLNLVNNIPRIKRLFIIKEIGDVLQVWMYLALIKMMGWNAVEVVMVTTDSVVYLFCILLGLSCIYTGERAGVRPGCCTLRHYLAGTPNYIKKYENMIEVYATRLIQHNTSTSMGLLRLIAEPSNFDYYVAHGVNPGYRRTIASKGLTSDIQRTRVNPLIRSFIKIIDTSTERVKLALQLVKTDIAFQLQGGANNTLNAQQNARNQMQIAQQETDVNAIELDQTDHVDVQAAVAAVRAAAATALVSAAALLHTVILRTAAVNAAAGAITAAGAGATAQQKAAVETAINDGYMHFCSVVDPLKQESMLTLLPNKRYIMLPGALLTAFVNFTNPPPGSVRVIPDVRRMIAGEAVKADAQRQFNLAIRGGGRGQRGGDPDPKKHRVDPLGAPVAVAVAAVAAAAAAPPPQFQHLNVPNIAKEDTSNYNECLVACYIQARRIKYFKLHLTPKNMTLKGNPVCSIEHYDPLIKQLITQRQGFFNFNELFNLQSQKLEFINLYNSLGKKYDLQIAFALDYDNFANALIREQNLEFDETPGRHGRTPNRKLLEDYFDSLSSSNIRTSKHISRSQILERGKLLLRFLHLAQDITDEVSSLKSIINERMKIFPPGSNDWIVNVDNRYNIYPNPLGVNDWIIDTRFHSWLLRRRQLNLDVPSFNPSTRCGGLRDPITYSLIDPALAIEITLTPLSGLAIRKCYQITTIVDYLIKSSFTLDSLPDLSTRNIISDTDKQNIANFIIMMYKLTPQVHRKLGRFLQHPIMDLLNAYNREMAPRAVGVLRRRLGAGQPVGAPAALGAPAAAAPAALGAPAAAAHAALGAPAAAAHAALGAPAAAAPILQLNRVSSGGTKRKTIKYKTKYKNKSKNQKIVNKHRMTRRNNIKTRRRTRKH